MRSEPMTQQGVTDMSQSQAGPDEGAKSKKINYVTIPILIAVLVGGGWFLYQRHNVAQRITTSSTMW